IIFSSTGQKIFSWMRLISFAWSRLNLTDFELVAGNKRTGIETNPKVRLAVDIERAAIAVPSKIQKRGPYYTGVLPRNSTINLIINTRQSRFHRWGTRTTQGSENIVTR